MVCDMFIFKRNLVVFLKLVNGINEISWGAGFLKSPGQHSAPVAYICHGGGLKYNCTFLASNLLECIILLLLSEVSQCFKTNYSVETMFWGKC